MSGSSSTLESAYPPASSSPSLPHPRIPYRHAPPSANYTRDSFASAINLVPHPGSSQKTPKGFSLNWRWLSKDAFKSGSGLINSTAQDKGKTKSDGGGGGSASFFYGWRNAFLGSYFNVMLFLIPVSFFLNRSAVESDTFIFVFCILALIPLVRLHDLGTSSLALRVGGTKAALLNASIGNTVELVIVFIALRKCELRIVQSSLIGTMLSKCLLVYGMCTFVGGLRWKEQWFNSEATQIQSSLLSISTSAVLLPAAFHFALRIDSDDDAINRPTNADAAPDLDYASQKVDILRMSHGVAVVMLLIYAAYLVFQLYSHTHLYKDTVAGSKSRRFSVKPLQKLLGESPVKKNSTHGRSSSITQRDVALHRLSPREGSDTQSIILKSDTSLTDVAARDTVKLVEKDDFAWSYSSQTPAGESFSSRETVSEIPDESRKLTVHEEEDESENERMKEPKLSWFMTMFLLAAVTVLVAVTADWLVESMDTIAQANRYVSKEWIGLILLPTVRVVAECVTAINTSVKDQLTLSSGVAIGSTIQTALFVIPFTVIIAWFMKLPLGMLFDPFESVVLYISIHTMNYVVADGKSNWMEGLILICLYFIIAISFWFYPGSNLPVALATCEASR